MTTAFTTIGKGILGCCRTYLADEIRSQNGKMATVQKARKVKMRRNNNTGHVRVELVHRIFEKGRWQTVHRFI